uniref:Uncharacterized protein n=1 Tax=Anguilla anguilla TaxID=7936 RepID=A0A0E9TFR4_ANGAN
MSQPTAAVCVQGYPQTLTLVYS